MVMDEEKLGLMGSVDVYVVDDENETAWVRNEGQRSGHRTKSGSRVGLDGLAMLTI
jgi:hypothetical protein